MLSPRGKCQSFGVSWRNSKYLFTILFFRYPSLTSLSSVGMDHSTSLLDVTTGGPETSPPPPPPSPAVTKRIELTAEFQRLNILLLRAVTGKMIGTALLTEVKIHSTTRPAAGAAAAAGGNQMSASGSLGGLQIMNLLTGSTLHQKIFSVGRDPVSEEYSRSSRHTGMAESNRSIHDDLYPSDDPERGGLEETPHASAADTTRQEALTFEIDQDYVEKEGNRVVVDVQLRMASVCYLHSGNLQSTLKSICKKRN